MLVDVVVDVDVDVVEVTVVLVMVVEVNGMTDQLSDSELEGDPGLACVNPKQKKDPGKATIKTFIHVYVEAHVVKQTQR